MVITRSLTRHLTKIKLDQELKTLFLMKLAKLNLLEFIYKYMSENPGRPKWL